MFRVISLLFILPMICLTNGYKFLVVIPLPGKSHAILGETMVEHIVEAGHEVTYITAFASDHLRLKVDVIDVGDSFKQAMSDGFWNIKDIMDKTGHSSNVFTFMSKMIKMAKLTLEHPNVQKLMADTNQQFDAVIVEWLYNEVYAGFAAVFDCPLIWLSTLEPHWMIMQLIDESPNPAYTADLLSDNIFPLTLKQRVVELYYQILGKLLQIFWISGLENELYERSFVPHISNRRSCVPSLKILKYNASLVLSNSHVMTGTAVRLPPNFISIGGYHIKPDVPPLPETLQNLMDNSEHGVIYFSMGSILRSKFFPDVVKQDLLDMLGKLNQTVIWKFEEDLPNRPSNVHILKWAPQHSILAHKNCVLFITHGGLLSTTEAIKFGVPTIGIPVFADQFINVGRSVKKGFAIKVDLSYTIATNLQVAINEMLNNSRYTATVKRFSEINNDRLVSPSKELVHWVEHVVKTQGALHLRSPALMVPWYQKLYLELILCLFIMLAALKLTFRISKSIICTESKIKIH